MSNPNICGHKGASAVQDGGDTCPGAQPHAVRSIQATVDIECQGSFGTLPNASNYSEVSIAQMQQAVARVFKGRFQIGEFDPHSTAYADIDNSSVFSVAHQQLSLQGAEQSIVLAQNAPTGSAARLPLRRGLKLALIGPNGDSASVYQGQYHGPSCPEQPTNSEYYACLPTALSEIRAANTGGSTSFVNGCEGEQACPRLVNQSAVKAAVAQADLVLLVLGEAIGSTNQEGKDRSGYALAGQQIALAKMVGSLNKPTVVIMLTGGAVGMDWLTSQKEWPILIPGYSGIFGPKAIARTLFGDASPAGLLGYTVGTQPPPSYLPLFVCPSVYLVRAILRWKLRTSDVSVSGMVCLLQVYPDSWDANCKGNNQDNRAKPGAPLCRNQIRDMGLSSGDGRTYRWYGYRNASLQATISFGAGTYYTEFAVSVSKAPTTVVLPSSSGGSRSRGNGKERVVASYAVAIKNVGQTPSRCRAMAFVTPVALDKSAPRPLPVKSASPSSLLLPVLASRITVAIPIHDPKY